jgi:hypothetical protein
MATAKTAPAQKQRERELLETEEEVGFPLLGYTVVPSLKGIEVEQAKALQILTPLGLAHFLPGLPETATALRRAVRRWMRELANKDLGVDADDKILLRDITRGSKSQILALALVVENSDLQSWGLSYLTNTRIFYNKQTDMLSLTRSASGQSLTTAQQDQDLLQKLEPHWHYYRTVYISADLGRMVARIIDNLGAFTMRKGGGAYNVLYQKRDELQTLKDLIELDLPAAPGETNSSTLAALPVIDRPKTKQQMSQLAHRSFMSELTTLQKDLQRFIDQAQKTTTTKKGKVKHGKVKAESMIARLADYQAMKNKIQLYHETLGVRQEELLASLDSLSATARGLMEAATDALAESEDLETGDAEQLDSETTEQEQDGQTDDTPVEGNEEEA